MSTICSIFLSSSVFFLQQPIPCNLTIILYQITQAALEALEALAALEAHQTNAASIAAFFKIRIVVMERWTI